MTMRTLIILSILVGSIHLSAQSDATGWFAFGWSEAGRFASVAEMTKSKASYKYVVASEVFGHLIEAMGDKRLLRPELVLSPRQKMMAAANSDLHLVMLEEKAYDVCTSFGEDSLSALATLLGHELIHYYKIHNWEDHFISENQGLKVTDEISRQKLANKMGLETQADQLGGLLAHAAGYPMSGIAPELLAKLYEAYGMSTGPNPQYPTLEERVSIAGRNMDRLKELVGIYDLAGYFLALKQYEWARAYYDHILTKGGFQSREVYNNLALSATLAALETPKDDQASWVYPLQLDLSSRMGTRGVNSDLRTTLLTEAAGHFRTAMDLDPDYIPAIINLGCVEAELNHPDEAQIYAKKAIRLALASKNKVMESRALILTGILQAIDGDLAGAEASFLKASALSPASSLAGLNLKVLKGEALPPPALNKPLSRNEQIDGVDPDKVPANLITGKLKPDRMIENLTDGFTFATVKEPGSQILVHKHSYKDAGAWIQVTDPTYTGSSAKGIKVGDPSSKVLEMYGDPERRMPTVQGEWWIYDSQQVLFRVEHDGNVASWSVFRLQKA